MDDLPKSIDPELRDHPATAGERAEAFHDGHDFSNQALPDLGHTQFIVPHADALDVFDR